MESSQEPRSANFAASSAYQIIPLPFELDLIQPATSHRHFVTYSELISSIPRSSNLSSTNATIPKAEDAEDLAEQVRREILDSKLAESNAIGEQLCLRLFTQDADLVSEDAIWDNSSETSNSSLATTALDFDDLPQEIVEVAENRAREARFRRWRQQIESGELPIIQDVLQRLRVALAQTTLLGISRPSVNQSEEEEEEEEYVNEEDSDTDEEETEEERKQRRVVQRAMERDNHMKMRREGKKSRGKVRRTSKGGSLRRGRQMW